MERSLQVLETAAERKLAEEIVNRFTREIVASYHTRFNGELAVKLTMVDGRIKHAHWDQHEILRLDKFESDD